MDAYTMHVTAFARQRRSLKLFSDFNNLQFASVMALVVFVILLMFMTIPTVDGCRTYADLPKVLHPAAMPAANREDAIKIYVLRDGKVYFGSEQVRDLSGLPNQIRGHLKDPDVEHKVYIVADMRARWGTLKLVLQGVQDAGIIRVAFLADQRHLH